MVRPKEETTRPAGAKDENTTRTSTLLSAPRVRDELLHQLAQISHGSGSVGGVLILPAALRRMMMTDRAADRGGAAHARRGCQVAETGCGPPRGVAASATVRVVVDGGGKQVKGARLHEEP